MPVKVETLEGNKTKLKVAGFRYLKAEAFKAGTLSQHMPKFAYYFQVAEWERGRKEDIRLREELRLELR